MSLWFVHQRGINIINKDYEILRDIALDHNLCPTQRDCILKVAQEIQDGIYVRMPCKVGDTVWAINRGEIMKCHVTFIGTTIWVSADEDAFGREFFIEEFGESVFTDLQSAKDFLKGV